MRIVLSPNPYRDKGLKAAQAAEKVLREAGVETCMCLPFDLEQSSVEVPGHLRFLPEEEALQGADMLVCFGGDGTILHAAKDAQNHGLPVLGVNLGSVGFMAELETSELALLAKLTQGKYRLEERMMLDVAVRREGKTIYRDLALNDAVITKGAVARIIDLDVKADGVLVGRFPGDGIIVSTPTGSTAYAHLSPCPSRPVLCTGSKPVGGGENGEIDPQNGLSFGGWGQGLSSGKQRSGGASPFPLPGKTGSIDQSELLYHRESEIRED